MPKLFKFVVNNYYWLFVGLAAISFFGGKDFRSFIIIWFVGTVFFVLNPQTFKWKSFDFIVLLFIFYQILSPTLFTHQALWYYGIKAQVMPILFYFFGRSKCFLENKMLDRMKWPMVIAFLLGLLLYFWSPGWYIARRTANLTEYATAINYYEVTRLSSFWPWSYAMGFGALYFIMYFSKDLFKNKVDRTTYPFLLIAVMVLFFAQQRVTIGFFFIFLALVTLLNFKQYKKKLVVFWIFIISLFAIFVFFVFNYMDSDFIDYLVNRSIGSDENIVVQRFNMFGSFWKVSLFGAGVGNFGHAALIYHLPSITDNEYIRFMAELGIIGCFFFGIIYMGSLIRAVRLVKYFRFELCILLFFAIAMIGATPFEYDVMQNFLFWYCIGRINNSNILIQRTL